MRVAVYHRNSDVRVEERPVPAVGESELLVRIQASGICGSDVMEWYRLAHAPRVLGHEIAGDVIEVGSGASSLAVGDRVVATHHVPCGRCRYCMSDRETVCPTLRTTCFDPGGFAELVRIPAINVERGTFRLSDAVSYEEATFVEPLACVVRAQRLAGVRPGDSLAVLGSGISGILQIQYGLVSGAGFVLATDVSERRLDAARRFGASLAVRAGEDVASELREGNSGRLADRVIVCTGAPAAFEQALGLVDDGGTIAYFAPLPPDRLLPIPQNELWRRGISIVHSYAGPPDDMRRALELITERSVDVSSMISHRLPLAEIGFGFALMSGAGDSDEVLKVIIEPQR